MVAIGSVRSIEARGALVEIEDSIRVSEPPPYGLTLGHPDFQQDIKAAIGEFRPDVVILDPWNAAAKDDKQADFIAAFDTLRNILPKGKDRPAFGIVAHTRKPKPDEKRIGGTGLMHLLAGSYILSSVPRTILVMVPGTTEETDNSVVLFNPKNSNGPCAGRTAWERNPSGFCPLPDFDWKAFDNGSSGRKVIRLEHIREALNGDLSKHSEAVKRLMSVSGCGERACQKALSDSGQFAGRLRFEDDSVGIRE